MLTPRENIHEAPNFDALLKAIGYGGAAWGANSLYQNRDRVQQTLQNAYRGGPEWYSDFERIDPGDALRQRGMPSWREGVRNLGAEGLRGAGSLVGDLAGGAGNIARGVGEFSALDYLMGKIDEGLMQATGRSRSPYDRTPTTMLGTSFGLSPLAGLASAVESGAPAILGSSALGPLATGLGFALVPQALANQKLARLQSFPFGSEVADPYFNKEGFQTGWSPKRGIGYPPLAVGDHGPGGEMLRRGLQGLMYGKGDEDPRTTYGRLMTALNMGANSPDTWENPGQYPIPPTAGGRPISADDASRLRVFMDMMNEIRRSGAMHTDANPMDTYHYIRDVAANGLPPQPQPDLHVAPPRHFGASKYNPPGSY